MIIYSDENLFWWEGCHGSLTAWEQRHQYILPVATDLARQVWPHFAQETHGENIDPELAVVLSQD